MNTYLSKTEREMFLKLTLLLGQAQEIVNAYEKVYNDKYMDKHTRTYSKNMPVSDKKFIKNIKTGKTYLWKALVERFYNLEPREMEQCKRVAKQYQLVILPSDTERANRKKMQEEMDVMMVNVDDFNDWYHEAMIYTCGDCPFHDNKKAQQRCGMRTFMEKYDVCPVNTHATGDECPYDYLSIGLNLKEKVTQVRTGQKDLKTVQRELAEVMGRAV